MMIKSMIKNNFRTHIFESFSQGIALLKHRQVWNLGVVDAIYFSSIQIFIFIWTPVLQLTADNKNINPGMIFIIMLLTFMVQNRCLDFLNRTFGVNFFL